MNKAQLIEALSERLGDKKAAGAAVDGLVDVIVRTVSKGEKVNITGFGVFEKRARAARTARNPRTGETVRVKKTNVPAFRPGTGFKDVISGAKKLPRVTAGSKVAGTATTSAARSRRASATSRPATRAITSRNAATKAAATKSAAASSAAKSTAKASTAKKPAVVQKAPAKAGTAKKSSAKK